MHKCCEASFHQSSAVSLYERAGMVAKELQQL